jgi:hypothetical protein
MYLALQDIPKPKDLGLLRPGYPAISKVAGLMGEAIRQTPTKEDQLQYLHRDRWKEHTYRGPLDLLLYSLTPAISLPPGDQRRPLTHPRQNVQRWVHLHQDKLPNNSLDGFTVVFAVMSSLDN